MGQTYITSSTAVIQKEYSYLQWPERDAYEELFDLTQDPHEQMHRVIDTELYRNGASMAGAPCLLPTASFVTCP
jgi:hypothetical protein